MNELVVGPPMFEPGVVMDMPAEVYHAVPALGSGGARTLLQSPSHFKVKLDAPRTPSANMELGTVIHTGILEPARLDDSYAVALEVDKRTTVGKAAWAAFQEANAERIILTVEAEKNALGAIAAVRAHPGAQRLLDGAICEISLFWEDPKYRVPCKARIDAANRGLAIDIKSTQDASKEAFRRSLDAFKYHLQAAHYLAGCEHALNERPRGFVFVAVETAPPYAVACYNLGPASILMGQHLAAIAYERYAEALSTGEWRGYPETIETIELPRWALRYDL